MKNIQVVENFMQGKAGQANNLVSTGKQLINYSTVIAKHSDINNIIFLDNTRYSNTTSTIQNMVRKSAGLTTKRLMEIEGGLS